MLAFASRRFRNRLSSKRLENLEAARDVVVGGPKRAAAGLGLFALSPLPSAQLFVAAGLVAAPIVPLTAAFFAGRVASYSIYVTVASAAKDSLGSIIQNSFTSPAGIALQIAIPRPTPTCRPRDPLPVRHGVNASTTTTTPACVALPRWGRPSRPRSDGPPEHDEDRGRQHEEPSERQQQDAGGMKGG